MNFFHLNLLSLQYRTKYNKIMAKTAFKGTPVTLAGEFVKAGTSAPEFTLVKEI